MSDDAIYAVLSDLETRLEKAVTELRDRAAQAAAANRQIEYNRLLGKTAGVSLALSYLREIDARYIAAVVGSEGVMAWAPDHDADWVWDD